MRSIVKDMKISRVSNAVAAGQTEVLTSVLDMAATPGFDAVIFVALLGAVTDGSLMTLTVKSNPTSSSAGGTTEKAGATKTGATSSNLVMATEVLRPSQQFVFGSFTRTVANAALDGILAIQFNSKALPTTQAILDAVTGGPNA